MGICVQPQTCERGGAIAGMTRHMFFLNCDGALRKQHTLHISIVNIAQTGPQRKGTLASDLKGAGARAPLTPP